jgi:multidrug efflux pump subunit AcrA (membrane-fusion protein)
VPRDAVIKRFGQSVLFVNQNNQALMLPVRILGYTQTHTAIQAGGLAEGMRVVVKGNERIFPNQPLQEKK